MGEIQASIAASSNDDEERDYVDHLIDLDWEAEQSLVCRKVITELGFISEPIMNRGYNGVVMFVQHHRSRKSVTEWVDRALNNDSDFRIDNSRLLSTSFEESPPSRRRLNCSNRFGFPD